MDLVHDRAGSIDLVHESGPWTPVHVLSSRDIYSLHAGSLQARFKFMIIPVRRSG